LPVLQTAHVSDAAARDSQHMGFISKPIDDAGGERIFVQMNGSFRPFILRF
jgi:hypothetical protein